MTSETRQKIIDNLLIPILAIISGLVVASVFVLMAGANPLTAYAQLFKAAFSLANFPRANLFVTFQLATPLMLTGLSAVVAFRSGLFSLGQEGQLMLGGIMAAWLGYVIHLPPVIHPIVAMLGAMLVGGASPSICGDCHQGTSSAWRVKRHSLPSLAACRATGRPSEGCSSVVCWPGWRARSRSWAFTTACWMASRPGWDSLA
jgi:hypothetical protein